MEALLAFLSDPVVTRSLGAMLSVLLLIGSWQKLRDMVVFAALGVFLGGRIGYTLFYNFPYYSQHPEKILAVWEGGMSFHGGLIGVMTVAELFPANVSGSTRVTVAVLVA